MATTGSPDPFRAPDDEARALARTLIAGATSGALGVREPGTGDPVVTRVAVMAGNDGVPMTLVSDLSPHTAALMAHPRCSLLLGEPGDRGDPLTHPRLTLAAVAAEADKAGHRAAFLAARPKAKLYYDFTDFRLIRLEPVSALLNAGFGQAYRLAAEDLSPPPA